MAAPRADLDPVRRTAWAKINLTLHVTGRRGDGYHELDSLIVFAGIGDGLEIAPGPQSGPKIVLEIDGPFAPALRAAAGDNLVIAAARALAARYGIEAGARLRLDKRLPVAAGLGGGSADAAAALDGLVDPPLHLERIGALGLGSAAFSALALVVRGLVILGARGMPGLVAQRTNMDGAHLPYPPTVDDDE